MHNCVSIHAPARGATSGIEETAAMYDVSIHAPARGATVEGREQRIWKMFQSTRPRGARRLVSMQRLQRTHCFNPRAREGRDIINCSRPALNLCFNPRAREGRDGTPETTDIKASVSIHAPARGATDNGRKRSQARRVSIHAPARGATPRARRRIREQTVSIHAPARGATHYRGANQH